ncbi:myosin IB heavy chain-like [Canna indica]|uniref:Myosin IB heavy chain-like n=1 Tax=Canna indica TaxID=4628 RepID=A0AAQ3JSY0_9LILI|nr:myosin IB heavy chain-like [Canna indica]
MDRFKNLRRLQVEVPEENGAGGGGFVKVQEAQIEEAVDKDASEDPGQFVGMMARRRAALMGNCKGDYVGVPSDPFLSRILCKQGDSKVLFADKVVKFTGSGKLKKLIMLITDFAIYFVDPDADVLKRRIALAAVERVYLSKFTDNFFVLIIPTEYDCLMASTRKAEIANVLVGATKGEVDVLFSNRFEYNAADDVLKEIEFEEVEGGIKARITKREIREQVMDDADS